MTTNLVKRVPGYRYEDGSTTPVSMNVFQHLVLEDAEGETRWYFKYFLSFQHQNIIGLDEEKNPFLISAVLSDKDNNNILQWRLIHWKKQGSSRICVPYTEGNKKELSTSEMLKIFEISKADKVKEIHDPDLQEDLLVLEEQEGAVNFKFGILLAKPGQKTDDEMFSNNDPSPQFNEFIEAIGTKVELKGFDRFRGGLDVKTGTTGTHSIWTAYHGHQIMFHVSTLLPYSSENAQQLERKRHLGNDIVNILFVDGDAATSYEPLFDPDEIKSHFIHVNAIVRYNSTNKTWVLNMATKDCVPNYGPPLPNPAVFTNKEELREFLLVKLMNGEKASYSAPVFLKKMERTLETLLGEIQKTYLASGGDAKKGNSRPFHEVGQTIRVKRIQSGLAPTSQIEAKASQWNPEKIVSNYVGSQIVCGDVWEDKVVVATTEGIFITGFAGTYKVIDKTSVVQLCVVSKPNILIARSYRPGKGGHIYVFPLQELTKDNLISKGKCNKFRISKSSGCHLFALGEWKVAQHQDQVLKLCIAIKNRVLVFEHIGPVTAGQFKFTQELLTPDAVSVLAFCDNNNRVCVGFRTEYDLIDLKTSKILELFVAEDKVNPLSAIPLAGEIVLCYNHRSIFKDFSGRTSRDYDLKWTTVPSAVAYHVPFVLAFAPESIEIRTLINGKIVANLPVPSVKYLTTTSEHVVFSTTQGGRTDICKMGFEVWNSSC